MPVDSPLAYVFWHTPSPGHPASSYEITLLRFHAALANDPPSGFVSSWTARISAASWMPGHGDGYEDWYLVEGFSALETLNAAAVSGTRAAPHDTAAEHTATGTAGLYRAWAGTIAPAAPNVVAQWLDKRPGMSYDRWRDALAAAVPSTAVVWQRQLVLGPTPEFAVRSVAGEAGRGDALPWRTERVTATLLPLS